MIANSRLWRTADGRLVADGHLDATSLAYTPGDTIAPADHAKATPAEEPQPDDEAAAKAAAPAANKARRAPAANK